MVIKPTGQLANLYEFMSFLRRTKVKIELERMN